MLFGLCAASLACAIISFVLPAEHHFERLATLCFLVGMPLIPYVHHLGASVEWPTSADSTRPPHSPSAAVATMPPRTTTPAEVAPSATACGVLSDRGRRLLLSALAAALLSAGCLSLVASIATASPFVMVSDGLGPPAPYLTLLIIGGFLLIHWPPLAACADVWYSGDALLGFEPSDAPQRAIPASGAAADAPSVKPLLLLLASFVCAIGGSASLLAAGFVHFDDRPVVAHGGEGMSQEGGSQEPLSSSENCHVIWGLRGSLEHEAPRGVPPTSSAFLRWSADGEDYSTALFSDFAPEQCAPSPLQTFSHLLKLRRRGI